MDKVYLETKRKEKAEYLEKLKIEINAVAGQIVLLDEFLANCDAPAKASESK